MYIIKIGGKIAFILHRAWYHVFWFDTLITFLEVFSHVIKYKAFRVVLRKIQFYHLAAI